MTEQEIWNSAGCSLQKILVVTDLTSASEKAIRHAAALSRHFGAMLYVVYLADNRGTAFCGAEAVGCIRDAYERDMQWLDAELRKSSILQGIQHRCVLLEGCLDESVETLAARVGAGLVVLGNSASHGFERYLRGSSTEKIMRHARCPVLTVGPGAKSGWEYARGDDARPLLFATAFGRSSATALKFAVNAAERLSLRLVLLHILDPDTSKGQMESSPAQEVIRRSTVQRLRAMVPSADYLPDGLEVMVASGHAAKGILMAAYELDPEVIVMGSHRGISSEAAAWFPWSTLSQVIRSASCPVMTVGV